MNGKVKIHGKEYLTVAYRINQFREEHPDWSIITELVESTDDRVVMKATIKKSTVVDSEKEWFINDIVIGTGYAEEKRDSSQINKTSALENCETSAIGRALAACGYGGTEYASANEVENAIHQQHRFKPGEKEKIYEQARTCLENGDEHGLKELFAEYGGPDEKMKVWSIFNSTEKAAIKEMLK